MAYGCTSCAGSHSQKWEQVAERDARAALQVPLEGGATAWKSKGVVNKKKSLARLEIRKSKRQDFT